MVRNYENPSVVKRILFGCLAAVFWIGVWYLAALWVGKDWILPTPWAVLQSLTRLIPTAEFWETVAKSLLRVLWGYLPGVLVGILGGILTAKSRLLNALLSPALSVIRATPVTSFILVVWLFFGRDSTPSFITFLMVLPIVWANVAEGVKTVDPSLKEVCRLYRIPLLRRMQILYIPHCRPFFSAGVLTALGLGWKAGVAAEVLCTPKFSVGKEMFDAKQILETTDLFAWTMVVILLSLILEKMLKYFLERGKRRDSRN